MNQTLPKAILLLLSKLFLLQAYPLFAQTCPIAAIQNNQVNSAQTICEGQVPAIFSGTVPTGGNGFYSYQWERSITSANEGFVPVQGATNQNYQSGALTQTAWFRRVVASDCQQSISNAVKVEVQAVPLKPADGDVTIPYGSSATLQVISPDPTLAYRWFNASTGGSPIATGVTYHTPQLVSSRTYYVEAMSPLGCISSRAAYTVTMNTAVGNNSIDASQTICAGERVSKLVGSQPTGGGGNYTYQWEQSADGVNFTVIEGAASKDYEPGELQHTKWFRRKVSAASSESSYSNIVLITVAALPGLQEVDVLNVCSGYSAKLSIKQPESGLTYRWYFAGGPNYVFKEGVSIYTDPVVQDTAYFVEAVNGAGCAGPRKMVMLRVQEAFYENNIDEPQAICAGMAPVKLGGPAPKGGELVLYEYDWEYSTDGVNYNPVPNLDKKGSKFFQPAALTQTTWFRRLVVSEFCSPSISEPVKITVLPAPAKPSINQGATTLTSSIAGVAYTWVKDGIELNKTASQSITIEEAGAYKVRVQNDQGCFSDFSEEIYATPQPNALTPKLRDAGIMLTPNPSSGMVTLQTQQPLHNLKVTVYSLAGREVHREATDGVDSHRSIDLTRLDNGVYVLCLEINKKQFLQRIAIIR